MSAKDVTLAAEVTSIVYNYLLTVDRDLAAAFKRKTKTKKILDDLPTIIEVFAQSSNHNLSPTSSSKTKVSIELNSKEVKESLKDSHEVKIKAKDVIGKTDLYTQKTSSYDSDSNFDEEPSKSMKESSKTSYVSPAKISSTKRPQLSSGSASGSAMRSPKAQKADKVAVKIAFDENYISSAENHARKPLKSTSSSSDKPNKYMKTFKKLEEESSTSSSSDNGLEKTAHRERQIDLEKLAHVKKTILMSNSNSSADENSKKSTPNSPVKERKENTSPKKNESMDSPVSTTKESLKLSLNTPTKLHQSDKRKRLSLIGDKKNNIAQQASTKCTPLKRQQSTSDSPSSDEETFEPTPTVPTSPNTCAKIALTNLQKSSDDSSSYEKSPDLTPVLRSPSKSNIKIPQTKNVEDTDDSETVTEKEVVMSTQKTLVESNFISTKITPSKKQQSIGSSGEKRRHNSQSAILIPITQKKLSIGSDSSSKKGVSTPIKKISCKAKPSLIKRQESRDYNSESDSVNEKELANTAKTRSIVSPCKLPPHKRDFSNSDKEKKSPKNVDKTLIQANVTSAEITSPLSKKKSDKSDSSSKEQLSKMVRKLSGITKLSPMKIDSAKKQESSTDADDDTEDVSKSTLNKITISKTKSNNESDSSSGETEIKTRNISAKLKVSPKQINTIKKQDSTNSSSCEDEKESFKRDHKKLKKSTILTAKITPAPEKKTSDESDSSSDEDESKTNRKTSNNIILSHTKITPAKKQKSTDSDSDTQEETRKSSLKTKTKPDSTSNKTAVPKITFSDDSDSTNDYDTDEEAPIPNQKRSIHKSDGNSNKITASSKIKLSEESDSSSNKGAPSTIKKFTSTPNVLSGKIALPKKQNSSDDADSSSTEEISNVIERSSPIINISHIMNKNSTDDSDSSIEKGGKLSPKILTKPLASTKTAPHKKQESSITSELSTDNETCNTNKYKQIPPGKKQQSTDDYDTEEEAPIPSQKTSIHKPDGSSNNITASSKLKLNEEYDSSSNKGAPRPIKKFTSKPKLSSDKITLPKKLHSADDSDSSPTEETSNLIERSSPNINIASIMNKNSTDDSDSSIEEGGKLSPKILTKPLASSTKTAPHMKQESSITSELSTDEESSNSNKYKQILAKGQDFMEFSKSKTKDDRSRQKMSSKMQSSSGANNSFKNKKNNDDSNSSSSEEANPLENVLSQVAKLQKMLEKYCNSKSVQKKKRTKLKTISSEHKNVSKDANTSLSEDSLVEFKEKKPLKSALTKRRKSSNRHSEEKLKDEPAFKKRKLHRESTNLSSPDKPSNRTKQKKSSDATSMDLSTTKRATKVSERDKGSKKRTRIGKKTGANKCLHCAYVAPRRSILKIHTRKHTGVRPHKCAECYKTFTVSSNLYRHTKIHSAKKSVKRSSDSDVMRDLRSHTGKKSECSHCLKTFPTSTNLYRHLKSSHSLRDARTEKSRREQENADRRQCNLECAQCGYVTAIRSDLKVHMRQHTGQTPYKCTVCERRFTQLSNMRRHIRKVHAPGRVEKEKALECPVCQKPLLGKLKRHLKTHAARVTEREKHEAMQAEGTGVSASKDGEELQKSSDTKRKKHQCDICDKVLATSGSLKRHLTLHAHGESAGKNVTPVKKVRSEELDVTSSSEEPDTAPRIAEGVNMSGHVCRVCNKSLATKSGYNRHMKRHSEVEGQDEAVGTPTKNVRGRKPHDNPTDKKKNKDRRDDSSSESDAKEPKQKNINSKWADHLRPLASPKTHECAHCGKLLSNASSLKRHSALHTRQGNTTTPQSEASTGIQSSAEDIVAADKNKRRKTIDEDCLKCQVCEKQLSTPSSLKRHLIVHTRGKTEPVGKDAEVSRKSVCDSTSSDHSRDQSRKLNEFSSGDESAKKEALHSVKKEKQRVDKKETTKKEQRNEVKESTDTEESIKNVKHVEKHKKETTEPEKDKKKNKVKIKENDEIEEADKRHTKRGKMENDAQDCETNTNKSLKIDNRRVSELLQCIICQKKLSSTSNLNRHMKGHTRQEIQIEDATAPQKRKPRVSSNSVASEVPAHDQEKDEAVDNGSDNNLFKCLLCDKQFTKGSKLQRHSKIHLHSDSKSADIASQETDNAKGHKKSTQDSERGDVEMEMRTERRETTDENSHKCSICEKEFSSSSKLKRHSKSHTREDNVSMATKMRNDSQSDNANSPLHSGSKKGDKGDSTLDTIKQRRKSTNEKSFTCPVCDKQFATNYNLNRHSKSHKLRLSEESPVVTAAKFPPKAFSHLRNESVVSPFECTICNEVFSTLSNRNRHVKSHSISVTEDAEATPPKSPVGNNSSPDKNRPSKKRKLTIN